jgi:tetratricopeptide (TPR) repeat protein
MAGVELLVLGQVADAAESFREARSHDSELAHTDINLGLIAQAAENWDDAIAHFNSAGARNPGFFHDEFVGRLERDPFRAFYNETILGYAGLGYHLGYCMQRRAGGIYPSGR